jgi:hypothetical protein
MLVVSTSQSLLLVEPETGAFTPMHRGAGLYYGIARRGNRWFVAARGRTPSSDRPGEEERGRVLVFDDEPRLVDVLAPAFPLRDMHELLVHADKLWVTCSYDNMVAVLDFADQRWERWYPLGETATPPYDLNHLNSLAVIDGELLLVAHNWGSSELLRFELGSRALRGRIPFGMQSHNVRECDGRLITCSSGDGTLIDTSGWRLHVGGFPRGLFMSERERYVGISSIAERHERDFTDGQIAVFDPAWRLIRTIMLPREGLVLDIQPFVRVSACN